MRALIIGAALVGLLLVAAGAAGGHTLVPLEMTSDLQLPLHEWTHIAVVLDGKRRRRGPTLFVNGQAQQLEPIKASARGLSTLVNAEGELLTPSVVLFDGSDIVVGKDESLQVD